MKEGGNVCRDFGFFTFFTRHEKVAKVNLPLIDNLISKTCLADVLIGCSNILFSKHQVVYQENVYQVKSFANIEISSFMVL